MNRLVTSLKKAKDGGKKILLPFLTGMYPDAATFVKMLLAVQDAGADGVEVGIPFSDPSADGPTIQATSMKAIAGGATVRGILDAVAEARVKGLTIPLIYMTYYNPVLRFGPERFASEAAASGADGVLTVDLPPEESGEFAPFASASGLSVIPLIAPTTPATRVPLVLEEASGFVYCVSVTGVTGVKKPAVEVVAEMVARVRPHTDMPVLVGFGVGDPQSAKTLAAVSDGVIVGSALLNAVGNRTGEDAAQAVKAFLAPIRAGLDT